MVMVTGAGLVIVRRAIVVVVIRIRVVITAVVIGRAPVTAVVISSSDAEPEVGVVLMCGLGRMLNPVADPRGSRTGKDDRQRDAKHREQSPQPWLKGLTHGRMLMREGRCWQGAPLERAAP